MADKFFIPTPENCDICRASFAKKPGAKMYDAKTRDGRWGCLCPRCFKAGGGKLGVGRGQQYERRHDGKFYMIAGGAGMEE